MLRAQATVAIEAVKRGLEMASGGVSADEVTSKGKLDVVTTMDVAVEELVGQFVSEETGLAVVGEELGGQAVSSGSSYWLLDPICGTRNYASGIPLYCINLALVEDDEVTLAVVGDPSTGEIDVTDRGHGAWAFKDDRFRPISAGDESETVIIETGRASGERQEAAARFTAEAIRADRWDLRALSSTLSLAYVAAGRVSAYVLFRASAVHTAAGSLLAAEAGAVVTDIDGNAWTVHSDSIVAAATPELHSDLLLLLDRDL